MIAKRRDISVVVGVAGERGLKISGLSITFKVFKDDTPNPNKADVEIHNLSPTTAALLQRKDCTLQLFTGYNDFNDLVFLGDVTRAITTYESAKNLTKITSGDGAATLNKAKVNTSIKGKTTAGDVLESVLKSVVEDPASLLGGLSDEDKKRELPNGFSASGPLKQVLRGLARTRLFDWTYIDGKLVIVSPNAPLNEPAIVVNARTGLIGSPAQKQINDGSQTRGVTFKVLLNAKIKPRSIIRLESREYTGFYLVRSVEHNGGTHTNDFFSVVNATEIRA